MKIINREDAKIAKKTIVSLFPFAAFASSW